MPILKIQMKYFPSQDTSVGTSSMKRFPSLGVKAILTYCVCADFLFV